MDGCCSGMEAKSFVADFLVRKTLLSLLLLYSYWMCRGTLQTPKGQVGFLITPMWVVCHCQRNIIIQFVFCLAILTVITVRCLRDWQYFFGGMPWCLPKGEEGIPDHLTHMVSSGTYRGCKGDLDRSWLSCVIESKLWPHCDVSVHQQTCAPRPCNVCMSRSTSLEGTPCSPCHKVCEM